MIYRSDARDWRDHLKVGDLIARGKVPRRVTGVKWSADGRLSSVRVAKIHETHYAGSDVGIERWALGDFKKVEAT